MTEKLAIGLISVSISIVGWLWLYTKNRALKGFIELPAKIYRLNRKEVSSEGFNKQFNIDIEYSYKYSGSNYVSNTVNIQAVGDVATWEEQASLYRKLEKAQQTGDDINVWVNTIKPEESTIVKNTNSSTKIVFYLSGCIGLGFLILYYLVKY